MKNHYFNVSLLCLAGLLLAGCGESSSPNNDNSACIALSCDNDNTGEETDTETDLDTDSDSEIIDDTDDNDTDSETDTTPEQPSTTSCKRGVAYGYHSEPDMQALSTGVSWWYNWAFTPENSVDNVYQDLAVEYIPMYWGDNYDANNIAAEIPSDAQVLLGFNEPNFYSQANLSASQAAALWPSVESIADDNDLYLVSPAVNYCGEGCYDKDPTNYLNEFLTACTDCRVDAIAIHIYVGCDASSTELANNRAQWLINHVESYKSSFDKPLWLTEFACSDNPTTDEQKAFLADAVEYLENEPRIERYAWFAGRADNMVNVDLLGDDGQLTELGETYVNAPFNNDDCE